MTCPETVKAQFVGDDGWPRSIPVPRSSVLSWMADSSLEVRGVVYHFLRVRPDLCRIDTPVADSDVYRFITSYFEDCLSVPIAAWDEEAEGSEWVLSDLDLSHAIAYWAWDYWRGHHNETDRSKLLAWLRSALLTFTQYQSLLATALADHFFRDRRIQKSASGWAVYPTLARLLPELGNVSPPAPMRRTSKRGRT